VREKLRQVYTKHNVAMAYRRLQPMSQRVELKVKT